jgi:hypothetical protein
MKPKPKRCFLCDCRATTICVISAPIETPLSRKLVSQYYDAAGRFHPEGGQKTEHYYQPTFDTCEACAQWINDLPEQVKSDLDAIFADHPNVMKVSRHV